MATCERVRLPRSGENEEKKSVLGSRGQPNRNGTLRAASPAGRKLEKRLWDDDSWAGCCLAGSKQHERISGPWHLVGAHYVLAIKIP